MFYHSASTRFLHLVYSDTSDFEAEIAILIIFLESVHREDSVCFHKNVEIKFSQYRNAYATGTKVSKT